MLIVPTLCFAITMSSSKSYSHFHVRSMNDDIRFHVAQSYTSSADSAFILISSLTLSNQLLLGLPPSYSLVLSFPSPSFLHRAPIFSSHAHTTSTSFPGLSLRCPHCSFHTFVVLICDYDAFIVKQTSFNKMFYGCHVIIAKQI